MPWKCEVCTLVNVDDNNPKCNLCGKPKGTPDPDRGSLQSKHLSLKAILRAGPEAFDHELQEKKRLDALKEIKGVFGVLLNTETPVVVCDCIAYLRAQGMYTEGLFRIPGNQDTVDALKHRYCMEKEEDVLNLIPCEVHDVCTLLKSYFRWLPEPIVPKESYDTLLNAARVPHNSKDELEIAVFSALDRVITPNKECMSLLIQFLREVTQFEKYNKMTPANLATCFAPSLLRAPDDVRPEQALMDMSAAISVLVVLIRSTRPLRHLPSKDQVKKATKHKPKGAVPPPPGLEGETKRRSSRKAFSLKKTFSFGKSKDKEKKKRSSKLGAPPGMGGENSKGNAPPPMPQRKDAGMKDSRNPPKGQVSKEPSISELRKKSKQPNVNIDQAI